MPDTSIRPHRLLRTRSQWAALVVCALLGLGLFAFVDLTPEIEADFFFSTDDPQLQGARAIEREFGSAPQIFIAAQGDDLFSSRYLQRIRRLTEDLRRLKGILDIRSLTRGPEDLEDIDESPFWSHLLIAPDRSASLIVLRVSVDEQTQLVDAIDRLLNEHSAPDFVPTASGVPYVAEHIRQRLTNELRRFSIVAFIAFAVLVAILFRSTAIVIGTMVAALSASFGTFVVRAALGMRTDILAPNLWTIAFVLTISHIVYLTAQWQRHAKERRDSDPVRAAIRLVGPVSLWSLAANLLGFASLVFVSATPLRQFGLSGIIAASLAIVCAYVVYPAFLRSATVRSHRPAAWAEPLDRFFTRPHTPLALVVLVSAAALAPFAWRVNTDPSLPSYFAATDRIRVGMEAFDRAGGSSPLDLVVADANKEPLDDDEIEDRLQALQRRLERHEDVGTVLSIALLMSEASSSFSRCVESDASRSHPQIATAMTRHTKPKPASAARRTCEYSHRLRSRCQ